MTGDGAAGDGRPTAGRSGDGRSGDGTVEDDEAHLAALLAVLALARADGTRHAASDRTPLQQWRARRLAALSAHHPRP